MHALVMILIQDGRVIAVFHCVTVPELNVNINLYKQYLQKKNLNQRINKWSIVTCISPDIQVCQFCLETPDFLWRPKKQNL